MEGKYVICFWKGGNVRGYWHRTLYRSDDYAKMVFKASHLARDGHAYLVFDDTHGLPETKEPTK